MYNKYIFSFYPNLQNKNSAASKAVLDIEEFVKRIGYKKIDICNNEENKYFRAIKLIYNRIKFRQKINNNSIILIQYPSSSPITDKIIINVYIKLLQKKRNITYIALIHDLPCIRNGYQDIEVDKKVKNEINNLNSFDYIISHNKHMSNWLQNNGIIRPIVNLELFDYKCEVNESKNIIFKKNIIFAGNLDISKSKFIYELNSLKFENLKFELYGPNFDRNKVMGKYNNIEYKGVVQPEELVNKISYGFGLVWDGHDIKTCTGNMGEYMKYNNPHKLSLYIASGIPVIVWNKAAAADFVNKYNIGITIESIKELDEIISSIDETKYFEMKNNVDCLKSKIINGHFIQNSIEKIENSIDINIK